MKKKFDDIFNKLIGIKNYDHRQFIIQLEQWVNQISHFYNVIVKEGQNPSKVIYKIPLSLRPKVGQVAYINLRRGYPKEIFDGHWCYILSDFGSKYIIVPITSEKSDSPPLDERFEMYIDIIGFENGIKRRLQITDIRSIDIMRVHTGKKPYDVNTDISLIRNKVSKILFDI